MSSQVIAICAALQAPRDFTGHTTMEFDSLTLTLKGKETQKTQWEQEKRQRRDTKWLPSTLLQRLGLSALIIMVLICISEKLQIRHVRKGCKKSVLT